MGALSPTYADITETSELNFTCLNARPSPCLAFNLVEVKLWLSTGYKTWQHEPAADGAVVLLFHLLPCLATLSNASQNQFIYCNVLIRITY